MKRKLRLWFCLCMATLVSTTSLHAEDNTIQRLQVVYLYNFTRYIHWPDTSLTDEFVIAVIGDDDFASALEGLVQLNRQVQERPIRILSLDASDQIENVQVLFVGSGAVSALPDIAARTNGKPILLVSDGKGMARQGIAINFFLQPDILKKGYRLRFEINQKVLEGRGLKVMSDLYDVAEIVK